MILSNCVFFDWFFSFQGLRHLIILDFLLGYDIHDVVVAVFLLCSTTAFYLLKSVMLFG